MSVVFGISASCCVYLHFISSASALWVHVIKEYSNKNNKKGETLLYIFSGTYSKMYSHKM